MSKILNIEDILSSLTDSSVVHKQLKKSIQSIEQECSVEEFGYVYSIADGIAVIRGLSKVFIEEVVRFDCGLIGIVKELMEYEVKVVLFNKFEQVCAGMKVYRTHKGLHVPVSDNIIGRVVDAFGNQIDGTGEIEDNKDNVTLMPIEAPAPKIIERTPVCEPLTTGTITIDSLLPIGLGQRELILGDMQTGKTTIAINAIINQLKGYEQGKPIYCFYVAIGQKMDNVISVYKKLKETGAMKYTTIVCAASFDSAHTQFISPYAGCAMAEYFMKQGKNCLIIYDDLSKHAIAYREISRLLGRPAGRDAYPADSFYVHARLLERAAYRNKEYGGGSITALPILETQDGDMSSYVSTNVISITDGQILLNKDRFLSQERPAVDIGPSVSRVGGEAQCPATRKVSRAMKGELSQYEELLKFSQFAGSNLDKVQANMLEKGRQTKLLLFQEQDEIYSLEDQVFLLAGSNYGIFSKEKEKKNIRLVKSQFLTFIREKKPELVDKVTETREISNEELAEIKTVAEAFLRQNGR